MEVQTQSRLTEAWRAMTLIRHWLTAAVRQDRQDVNSVRGTVRARRLVQIQGFIVFAVTFGIPAVFASHGVDLHHDGIMLKPALDVSQGKMLFRDTFTQYGGVTVLLQAAAIKLFGPYLVVIRLQTALMYGLAYLTLWRAWARLIPAWLAAFVCIVGSLMAPDSIASSMAWSSVYAASFQGLALLCAIRYLETARSRELVLSGVAGGLSFWCRQPVGALLCVGMYLMLSVISLRGTLPRGRTVGEFLASWSRSWLGRVGKTTLLFGGGVLIVNSIVWLWLFAYGALGDWWKQSIVFAKLFGGATYGHEFTLKQVVDCLFPAGDMRVWTLLAIPVAVQLMRSTARFLDPAASANSVEAAAALLASAVAVTSWLQYFPIPCVYHCYWASIPMFGVFAYLFYSSHISASRAVRSLVVVAVFGVVFYKDISWRIESAKPRLQSQGELIRSIPTLRGMYTTQAELWSYDALASLIDSYHRIHPEGGVVTTSRHGLFPALAVKQATFHPLYMMWDEIMPKVYPEAVAVRDEYIKNHLPLVVGPTTGTTHIRVASLWWGGMYDIYVPKDTHPTEFVTCDGTGPCRRGPVR